MYFINPFKGLRPTKENASSVSVASTDHLSDDLRKDHLKKNPWSYLNVFNAENNKKSREQFELNSYKRLLDIYSSSTNTVDALMKLELPSGVEVEIKA